MTDVKKVIEDLIIAKCILISPQPLSREMCIRIGQAISAAVTLLKEPEPVEPIPCNNSGWFFKCGACGGSINWKDKYCSECGRKVKLG